MVIKLSLILNFYCVSDITLVTNLQGDALSFQPGDVGLCIYVRQEIE